MRFDPEPSMHPSRNFLVMLVAVLLFPTEASAQTVLRYSDHEPLGGMRTRFIKEVLFAAIEKESKGRLKVEEHWNAELSSGYGALQMVGSGRVADLAIVVPEYSADALPLHQIFKSFPTGPSGEAQVAFFRQVYAEIPDFSAELAKNNVVEVFLGTGYPVAFFATKPMKTLDDLRGARWRSASFWHQDFLRNAGAIPVSMPWDDGIYKALEAGTLDGLMVNVDSGYDLSIHKIAPHVLISKDLWLGHLYLLVMNRDTWNGLAQEDRNAIQRAAETAYATLGSVMDSHFNAMLDDLRRAGASVRLLESKELRAWETSTRYQDVQIEWARKQADKGVKDVGTVLREVSAQRRIR